MIDILPFVYTSAPYVQNALKLREFFQDKVADLLVEIGGVHIQSFRQAMAAASKSRDYATEIRIGIGHLRDSFNFFGAALQKRRFLIFGPGERKRMKLHKQRAMVAALASLAYRLVGDGQNAQEWANDSLEELGRYGDICINIDRMMDINARIFARGIDHAFISIARRRTEISDELSEFTDLLQNAANLRSRRKTR